MGGAKPTTIKRVTWTRHTRTIFPRTKSAGAAARTSTPRGVSKACVESRVVRNKVIGRTLIKGNRRDPKDDAHFVEGLLKSTIAAPLMEDEHLPQRKKVI